MIAMQEEQKQTRHIIGVSGGKDSAALAVHMRDRIQEMEYVFCDTGKELEETYEYIDRLEVFLGKHIVRLPKELPNYSEKYDFDHFLEIYGGMLPSQQVRWCTKNLKLGPFEAYIGSDQVINYVGIRADEYYREGYISTKDNVTTTFPFVEDNINKEDVFQILEDAGLGFPEYYKWRSRSGCYFCFFQRKDEWVGLKERHPDLYEKAKKYEKEGFSWRSDMSLNELEKPEMMDEIKESLKNRVTKEKRLRPNAPLSEILDDLRDDENDNKPCLICHL